MQITDQERRMPFGKAPWMDVFDTPTRMLIALPAGIAGGPLPGS